MYQRSHSQEVAMLGDDLGTQMGVFPCPHTQPPTGCCGSCRNSVFLSLAPRVPRVVLSPGDSGYNCLY